MNTWVDLPVGRVPLGDELKSGVTMIVDKERSVIDREECAGKLNHPLYQVTPFRILGELSSELAMPLKIVVALYALSHAVSQHGQEKPKRYGNDQLENQIDGVEFMAFVEFDKNSDESSKP